MLGGLNGELGAGRLAAGAPAVSQSWDRDVAGGFVEELFAKHQARSTPTRPHPRPGAAADLTDALRQGLPGHTAR
jgi:hypothetical protein